jgi:hypothetical protein
VAKTDVAREDLWVKWNQRIRDVTLFVLGLGAAANELFLRDDIRPTAIPVIATLLGLPIILRQDEKKAP